MRRILPDAATEPCIAGMDTIKEKRATISQNTKKGPIDETSTGPGKLTKNLGYVN
jgi:hypothetical protein